MQATMRNIFMTLGSNAHEIMKQSLNIQLSGYYTLSCYAQDPTFCFPQNIYLSIEGNHVKIMHSDQTGDVITSFEIDGVSSIKWFGKDVRINILPDKKQIMVADNSVNHATYTFC